MAETRRRFDPEFRAGAVRIVWETGKPIAQVARDLGINAGTLGNWVDRDRAANGAAQGCACREERAGGADPAAPGERRAGDGA